MNVSGAHRYHGVLQPVTVCDAVRFVDLKDGYRYGFGGQEKDDEVAGEGELFKLGVNRSQIGRVTRQRIYSAN